MSALEGHWWRLLYPAQSPVIGDKVMRSEAEKHISNLLEEIRLVSEQRDMIAATADRYEAALQYVAGHADDECQDIGCVVTAAASALHWKQDQQEEIR